MPLKRHEFVMDRWGIGDLAGLVPKKMALSTNDDTSKISSSSMPDCAVSAVRLKVNDFDEWKIKVSLIPKRYFKLLDHFETRTKTNIAMRSTVTNCVDKNII